MSDVKPIIDDEIDLFALVEILWNEKFVIGFFLAVALVAGGLLIRFKEETYETSVRFEIITLPPLGSYDEVVSDLQRGFHSKNKFFQWSEVMPNAKLQLADVFPTILRDGITFTADVNSEAAVLLLPDKVLIKSNEPRLILDAVDYTQFLSDELSKKYTKKIQEEYDRLLALSDRLYERRDRGTLPVTFNGLPTLDRLATLDSYLNSTIDDRKLLSLYLPSQPVVTSVSSLFLLGASVVIGGVTGVLFCLIRHAYRQRKSVRARLVS